MTAKEVVRSLMDRLPDDCTLDDISYQIYVIQAIDRGLSDVQAGRTLTQEELESELREQWSIETVR